MKLLFVLGQKALIRHFDTVILGLADRGHTVRLATAGRQKTLRLPPRLTNRPEISEVACPPGRTDEWESPTRLLRCLRDYARYIEPPYAAASKLRLRALRKLVQAATDEAATHAKMRCPACRAWIQDEDWTSGLRQIDDGVRANLMRVMALAEEALPVDGGVRDFIAGEAPDLLIVTPLVNLGASQADFVKAGQALGLPVVFPVFSWDNLSNKGLIHVMPDRVLVWNERQKREAVELHGVPPDRIVLTGAARFDDFLALRPSTDRAAFCAARGLDPAAPIVTYLGSSEFVAPHERGFVERWIDAVRNAPEGPLNRANVIVRPHPRNRGEWLAGPPPVQSGVWVSISDYANADRELFDILHHSAAAVGLNTSAEIEAALAERTVFTIRVDEFAPGQSGTLHFHYLLREQGGFVEAADTVDQHLAQLGDAVAGRFDRQRLRQFRKDFVRPGGADTPATPAVVDAIEQTPRGRSSPTLGRWIDTLRRPRT